MLFGSLNRWILRYRRIPTHRKRVLSEAFFSTLGAWALIRLSPYRFWRSRLGQPLPLTNLTVAGKAAARSDARDLVDIAWAHAALARVFHRYFTCLMLALSAQAMLARRHRSSVLVLGVKRAEALAAHAWVLSDGFDIIGGNAVNGHVAVAAYRWPKQAA